MAEKSSPKMSLFLDSEVFPIVQAQEGEEKGYNKQATRTPAYVP